MNNSQYPTSLQNTLSPLQAEEIQRGFITRVYGWMTLGLFVTAGAALMTLVTPGLLTAIVNNQLLFLGLIFGELGLVIGLTAAIRKMNPLVAAWLFIGYAALNGVTLSIIMLVYTASSVAVTFGIAACTFGIMSLWGYTTHRDLTKLGSLLIMALLGLILGSVINLFIGSTAVYWITTYVGILIFIGLIAYDTQKLKNMSLVVNENGEAAQKASIVGALALYLDFINLFLMLLRIFGRRK
jgi:FtsH-binding integral membrane protein